MNYPIWQLGYPGGMLIALVAILHVVVSHFAIGGGAFLVISEARAYGRNDEALLAYVRRHSNFFALLTLVFGAVSGVGIWFTIGLVSPEATSSLIHTFVWAWAIEWVFFFVEIAAAIIYAKSWDRLSRRDHLTVGWIYFVAAWMSLFVINGIITYQLTPGRWTETHKIWDGFFNPTYWPSLFARTAMSVLLAGIFGFITLGREQGAVRDRLARWASTWTLAGAVALPFCMWWYFHDLPGFSQAYLGGQMIAMKHSTRGLIGFASVIVLITLLTAWKPRVMRAPVVALVILCGLGLMGASEYMREFVRKPWVVNGYIYANDVHVSEVPMLVADGAAKHAKFVAVDASSASYGRELFVLECSACHSVDGYRSMRKRVNGWDADTAKEMLAHIEKFRAPMPQFGGNEQDRAALGAYLASLNGPVQYGAITDANRVSVGANEFKIHCGTCHTVNGNFRPLRGAFEGSTAEQAEALLPMLDSMSPNMPHYMAPDDHAKALAAYLTDEANKPIAAEPAPVQPVGGNTR